MADLPLAVVLASGGLDSCVTAAIAARQYRLAMLHASYGQRTQQRERSAFAALADHFAACCRLEVDLTWWHRIGGSSLTDPSLPIPDGQPPAGQVPSTYVPFRNANLLAIAYSKAAEMAETLKDSGRADRPPMTGETGWQGGVIQKVKTGYLIAAFSGGPSEADVQVSRAGLAAFADKL